MVFNNTIKADSKKQFNILITAAVVGEATKYAVEGFEVEFLNIS